MGNANKMKTIQMPDSGEWWIVNVPDSISECGPYDTRKDAETDRIGLVRFFNHEANADGQRYEA